MEENAIYTGDVQDVTDNQVRGCRDGKKKNSEYFIILLGFKMALHG